MFNRRIAKMRDVFVRQIKASVEAGRPVKKLADTIDLQLIGLCH